MGKKNHKKRKHALFHAVQARMLGDEPKQDVVVDDDTTTISDADLATTIRVLEQLANNANKQDQDQLSVVVEVSDKRYKDLRRALHPLVLHQLRTYDNGGIDYRHKVTHALEHGKWSDALFYLQACADFDQVPKQGTVQRWVRHVNAAASTGSMGCQLQLLRAMVQLGGGGGTNAATGSNSTAEPEEDLNSNQHSAGQALATVLAERKKNNKSGGQEDLIIMEGWKWWNDNKEASDDSHPKNDNDTITTTTIPPWTSRVLYHEAAAARTPPNHYDLHMHVVQEPQWMTWNPSNHPPLAITKHVVPFLQHASSSTPAFVLANVLTKDECHQLRQAATTLGFQPDHPVTLQQPTGIDSCEWFVGKDPTTTTIPDAQPNNDDTIATVIFERVQSLLPQTIRNAHLHSINPRWRCFRYDQDCVYRPHLDGSWPASHIDDEGNYVVDTTGTTPSYLTFLIYLNDDFQGGETRFYLPPTRDDDASRKEDAIMTAHGVVPKEGSVLVFPQGNTASLIHEGSAVTQGTKYVVRTDVLYTTEHQDEEEERAVPIIGPNQKKRKQRRA